MELNGPQHHGTRVGRFRWVPFIPQLQQVVVSNFSHRGIPAAGAAGAKRLRNLTISIPQIIRQLNTAARY